MESLFAYSYLWAWGFCSAHDYNECLDRLFLETTDDEILLGLEECSDDYKETFARMTRYYEYEASAFDLKKFGRTLFCGLEAVYKSGRYTITEFGNKCYELWNLLPSSFQEEEPFFILSYADEPLSWGDEVQSKILYEATFNFYKE